MQGIVIMIVGISFLIVLLYLGLKTLFRLIVGFVKSFFSTIFQSTPKVEDMGMAG